MAKTELIESVEFSYDLVEKDQAEKLRYCAKEFQKYRDAFAVSVMGIGATLAIAQETLANNGNGMFLKFVEKCGFSKSSAYRILDAYRVFANVPTVGRIEDSAMYALSHKDTPEKALKEVLVLAEKGVQVTQKQAKAVIKKHAPPKGSSGGSGGATKKSNSVPEPPKPEPTKDELLKLELKKVRSYAEYLQRGVDDLNHIKRNTVIHPQLIKLCGQILEGLERW